MRMMVDSQSDQVLRMAQATPAEEAEGLYAAVGLTNFTLSERVREVHPQVASRVLPNGSPRTYVAMAESFLADRKLPQLRAFLRGWLAMRGTEEYKQVLIHEAPGVRASDELREQMLMARS